MSADYFRKEVEEEDNKGESMNTEMGVAVVYNSDDINDTKNRKNNTTNRGMKPRKNFKIVKEINFLTNREHYRF